MRRPHILAALLTLSAAAQAQTVDPANNPQSRMGAPTQPARSGIGTEGSLDRNAGTASSTITGNPPPMGNTNANAGADKAKETDPSLGGGSQK